MDRDARNKGWTRILGLTALVLVASWLVGATGASAQCAGPSTHFRGGLWKQWILWITPGPEALAAVERVIGEINVARAAASIPLLVFDPQEPLVVGIIEENNPRGPDGALLANRLPNQEIFFATFAEVGTADGDGVVLFLTDPLRSNAELTEKGVPGAPAAFERTMRFGLQGPDSEVSTRWTASNGGDLVKFSAKYPSAAITFRQRFPGTEAYLSCNLAKSVAVVYRSLPTQTFALHDRTQANVLLDLARSVWRPDLFADWG
jgi:hypothetical protein